MSAVEVIELDDQISGPANAAAGALGSTERAVAALRASINTLGGGQAQALVAAFENMRGAAANTSLALSATSAAEHAVTSEIQKQIGLQAKIATFDANRVRETHKLEQELKKMNEAALPKQSLGAEVGGGLLQGLGGGALAGGAGGLVAGFASSLLASAKHMVEETIAAAFNLVKAGAEFAIAATDFRTETVDAFSAMVGGAAVANGLYDKVLDIAARTGLQKESLIGETRRLLTAGFHAEEVPALLTALAGLEKVKGEGTSKGVEKVLEKINVAGKLDAKGLNALQKQGIEGLGKNDVLDALGGKLGKTRQQVEALVKAGKISGDMGIDAVAEVLEKKFGKALNADTVGAKLRAVGIRFGQLFDQIDTSPIKGALDNVLGVLQGQAGGGLKTALGNFFGTLFHTLFDPFKGADGQQRITAFITTVTAALNGGAAVFKAFAPVVRVLVDALRWLTEGLSNKGTGSSVLSTIGAEILRFLNAVNPISGAVDQLMSLFAIIDSLSSLEFDLPELPDLGELGSQMMNGLIDGIAGGASGVVTAMVNAVSGAVNAAEAFLGIASPSKVFGEMGAFSAQGFAGGIAANDGAPAAASAAMAQRSASAAAYGGAAGSALAGPAAAGGGDTHVTFAPVLHVTASDEEGGKKAGEAAMKAAEGTFRQMMARLDRERMEAA